MNGRNGTGRIVLGAFVMVLAALAATGGGRVAAAEKYPIGDQNSAGAFQASCERAGGTFTGPTPFGYTICTKGSNKIVCDKNGKNCSTNVPPAHVGGESDPRAPGTGDAGVLDDGSTSGQTGGGSIVRAEVRGSVTGSVIVQDEDEP